jgi:hypothetical protein
LLTFWKSRISRDSDPPDPKETFNDKKNSSRDTNGKSTSERSETSVELTVEDVQELLRRKGAAPAEMYSHYLGMPSDQRLEYLVKAVLHAKKLDTSEWERYRPMVLEASAEIDA